MARYSSHHMLCGHSGAVLHSTWHAMLAAWDCPKCVPNAARNCRGQDQTACDSWPYVPIVIPLYIHIRSHVMELFLHIRLTKYALSTLCPYTSITWISSRNSSLKILQKKMQGRGSSAFSASSVCGGKTAVQTLSSGPDVVSSSTYVCTYVCSTL